MVEEIMDFVKCDLVNYCLVDNAERHEVVDKYDLAEFSYMRSKPNEEPLKANMLQNVRNIWSCESNQSLFVVMQSICTQDKLYSSDTAVLHSQRKIESG